MPVEMPAVRILIVDDDRAICDYMQTLLERDGYEVKALGDPLAVEEEVRTGGYHLIILDLMMPDVDGFEVVSKLKEDAAASQIPILIYTAKNITSEDRERLQGNIQSIIQKGDFGKDRFLEMINNLQTSQAA